MAYAHCCSCDWSQGDFWSWRGYNPLRFFFRETLPWLWRPRFMEIDEWYARDMAIPGRPTRPGQFRVHSWAVLWNSISWFPRRIRRQHWWTWKSYKKSDRRCPKCGSGTITD